MSFSISLGGQSGLSNGIACHLNKSALMAPGPFAAATSPPPTRTGSTLSPYEQLGSDRSIQGTEMARHLTITRSLGAPVYF